LIFLNALWADFSSEIGNIRNSVGETASRPADVMMNIHDVYHSISLGIHTACYHGAQRACRLWTNHITACMYAARVPLPHLMMMPPALCRKAATSKLVEKIVALGNWAIHSDITNPSRACLPSRKPLWQVWTSEVNGKKLEVGSGGQLFPSG